MSEIAAAPQDGEIACLVPAVDRGVSGGREDWPGGSREPTPRRVRCICDLERKITRIAAQGPVGLAIKAYLIAHDQHGGTTDAPSAGLVAFDRDLYGDDPESLTIPVGCTASLMHDAARFVPEIAELAAAMIGPPIDPPGGKWCGSGGGSGSSAGSFSGAPLGDGRGSL